MQLSIPYSTFLDQHFLTGSRVTCNPPPTDTDQDVMVLTYDLPTLELMLQQQGWVSSLQDLDLPHSIVGSNDFISYIKDDINLIITTSGDFYDRSFVATELAKRFNLMDKQDRIDLFTAIRYGKLELTPT